MPYHAVRVGNLNRGMPYTLDVKEIYGTGQDLI